MLCKNKFCVFQKEEKCNLSTHEIDINGVCKNCIHIKIDNKTLDELKHETLNDLIYCNNEKRKKLSSILHLEQSENL